MVQKSEVVGFVLNPEISCNTFVVVNSEQLSLNISEAGGFYKSKDDLALKSKVCESLL